MTRFYCGLLVVLALFGSDALADPLEKCQPRNSTYLVGDHRQCDKYHECGKAGKFTERLCDDGFVFSQDISQCDYPHNVNCSERPELQPSKSLNDQCARLNGFYAFPASESCQKFYHCLEGTAYEKTCPEGVIFDDARAACVHPDLAVRVECSASKVLNFECPNSGKRFSKLRFGDHDRHAHPSDCRKFFICTRDGQPRIGGCPLGKVFNPKSGTCGAPKHVPNCVDYYGKKELPKEEGGESSELESQEEDSEEDNNDSAEDNHLSESAAKNASPSVPHGYANKQPQHQQQQQQSKRPGSYHASL